MKNEKEDFMNNSNSKLNGSKIPEDDASYNYPNDESDNNEAVDSYLDDDEEFLLGDDSVIADKDVLGLFKQSDNVISYEVLNFYNENGKPRNRMSLRNDPPVLHISSSNGDTADFILTRNFTKNAAYMLKEVDKAYSGISPQKNKKIDQEEIQGTFKKIVSWAKNNKVKSITLGALIALFVVYTIIISF